MIYSTLSNIHIIIGSYYQHWVGPPAVHVLLVFRLRVLKGELDTNGGSRLERYSVNIIISSTQHVVRLDNTTPDPPHPTAISMESVFLPKFYRLASYRPDLPPCPAFSNAIGNPPTHNHLGTATSTLLTPQNPRSENTRHKTPSSTTKNTTSRTIHADLQQCQTLFVGR